MKALRIATLLTLIGGGSALAQTAPAPVDANGDPSPIALHYVWTPPQWSAAWRTKVDVTGGSSTNQTITNATLLSTATFNGKSLTDPTLMGFIAAPVTWTVCASGCTYTDPYPAFVAATNAELAGPQVITISVGAGTYTETNQFYTENPMGKFVRIVGSTTNPASVILNFTNIAGTNFGGFVANLGGQIGYIDGMTLNGVGAKLSTSATGDTWASQSYGAGVGALQGGIIQVGPHVTINNFYYGVVADNNGIVDAPSGGVTATGAGDVDFMARGGGTIICNNCTASRASDITNPTQAILGSGFDAERGGTLYVDGSTSSGTRTACLNALTNGAAWAHQMKCTGGLGGLGAGFWALENGSIETTGSTVTGYTNGVYVGAGGNVDLSGTAVSTSSGDNIYVDGGAVTGTGASSKSAGAYGIHLLHTGRAVLYGSLSGFTANTSGVASVEAAGTQSGYAYQASSLVIN